MYIQIVNKSILSYIEFSFLFDYSLLAIPCLRKVQYCNMDSYPKEKKNVPTFIIIQAFVQQMYLDWL